MPFPPLIWDSVDAEAVPPEGMDLLWSQGWRHFGRQFFRYIVAEHAGRWQGIVPLRIDLQAGSLSKSQRRVLRKNADLTVLWTPVRISEEAVVMFERHKARFKENVPESLACFLGETPEKGPCQCLELQCRLGDRLVAVSFVDVGHAAVSSVYGIFEPEESRRSLGIFTMLLELEWARQHGFRYHYPGYAMTGPSHYDYKKQFDAMEGLDWESGEWRPVEKSELKEEVHLDDGA